MSILVWSMVILKHFYNGPTSTVAILKYINV